ncbi:MAG TPA: M36 family metallopeptidase [Candidatus Bathyarchaeia archaeon]|nr:M36 family metallopeptidase [Candidatus Bathyarchaeia archaeon]
MPRRLRKPARIARRLARRGALHAALIAALRAGDARAATWRAITPPDLRPPATVASDFTRAHAADLQLDAGQQMTAAAQPSDASGTLVRYSRTIGDVRVQGGEVIIHVRPDGRIDYARARSLPPPAADDFARLTPAEAEAIARAATAADPAAVRTRAELVYFPLDGELRLAWEIWLFTDEPPTRLRVFVDASSGLVLRAGDLVRRVDGTGLAFIPNPVVKLKDDSLEDDDDSAAAVPAAAYSPVTLRDLDAPVQGLYQLSGPYVRAVDIEPPTVAPPLEPTPDFSFDRSQSGFEWVMVYYHIDSIQRFVQGLGFSSACNRRIDTDAHGVYGADNSYYVPDGLGRGLLAFGDGGVDDAEDGEVIAHEYGHAIQDSQCPNCFDGPEAGAIGEGWGDFLAAAYFSDKSGGFQDTCLADWDSRAYSDDVPSCLRRLDTSKRYPEDVVGEVHADGEIWSGALWDILIALSGGASPTPAGRDTAVSLALESHMLVPSDPSFFEEAQALLDADHVLFGGVHQSLLAAKLSARGLLPILGGGPAALDCAGTFAYTNPSNPRAFRKNRQTCTDGDPNCDADSVPGQCTFRIAACFGQSGIANCTPQPTLSFQLRTPHPDSRDPALASIGQAMIGGVASLPGSAVAGRHDETVLWLAGLPAGSCAPAADVVVPLRAVPHGFLPRAVTIRTTVRPASGKPDLDRLELVCMPAS